MPVRALFASEQRSVSNLWQMLWGHDVPRAPTVVSEMIAGPSNPRKTPWFNCDFIFNFVDWRTFRAERSASACSVLPNALGAELFLIVEKATLAPTALELNGASAFPIGHYATWIAIVEAAIHRALDEPEKLRGKWPLGQMSKSVRIEAAAFARVLVVEGDVTFLYFPHDTTPLMRGKRICLVSRDDARIDCYVDDDTVICFDGWVRTSVTHTDATLVAERVQ